MKTKRKSNNEILLQNPVFLREKHTFGKTVEIDHEPTPLGPSCSLIGHVATDLRHLFFDSKRGFCSRIIMKDLTPIPPLGERCILGQNVNIQNNVSVYEGTTIESDVFLGPSCVLTNVSNPRSQVLRHSLYGKTLIRRGATIGANATVVCGITLSRYCFIAAGAVVTKDVPDYAMIVGIPGKQKGWMSRHGHILKAGPDDIMVCPESGFKYREISLGVLKCLDIDEEKPLPESLNKGKKTYKEFKN